MNQTEKETPYLIRKIRDKKSVSNERTDTPPYKYILVFYEQKQHPYPDIPSWQNINISLYVNMPIAGIGFANLMNELILKAKRTEKEFVTR